MMMVFIPTWLKALLIIPVLVSAMGWIGALGYWTIKWIGNCKNKNKQEKYYPEIQSSIIY